VKMAAEGPSSFDANLKRPSSFGANPKRAGLQPQCEGSHCRNAKRFFVGHLRQWLLDGFDQFREVYDCRNIKHENDVLLEEFRRGGNREGDRKR
jgi:hypothetical protein